MWRPIRCIRVIIYGGKVTRYDKATGEVQEVGPSLGRRGGKYRFVRTMPLLFSPVDPHILYLGSQYLLRTANGGQSWEEISPDLTRASYEIPPSLGSVRLRRSGEGQASRRHLHHCALLQGRQCDLGGHRRRLDPGHARRAARRGPM